MIEGKNALDKQKRRDREQEGRNTAIPKPEVSGSNPDAGIGGDKRQSGTHRRHFIEFISLAIYNVIVVGSRGGRKGSHFEKSDIRCTYRIERRIEKRERD
jgi:hypothetical protein